MQGEFSAVTTKALSTLVIGIETKLDVELVNMTRLNWASVDSVGDQSEYTLRFLLTCELSKNKFSV